jgi:hypothetical protein
MSLQDNIQALPIRQIRAGEPMMHMIICNFNNPFSKTQSTPSMTRWKGCSMKAPEDQRRARLPRRSAAAHFHLMFIAGQTIPQGAMQDASGAGLWFALRATCRATRLQGHGSHLRRPRRGAVLGLKSLSMRFPKVKAHGGIVIAKKLGCLFCPA